MTLSFRNRTLKSIFITAILAFIVLSFYITMGFYTNRFSANTELLRIIPIFSTQYMAVLSSIVILVVYVIIVSTIIFFLFQKIQSSEVIYFSIFLVSCLFEALRFVILYISLTGLYSDVLLVSARAIFFAQTCAPLSFLIAAIFLGRKQEDNIERFCSLVFAASIICSFFMPFNTGTVTSNGMLTYGFMTQINIMRILLAILAFCCFLINCTANETAELKGAAYGYLVLYLGYLLLTVSDNFLLFSVGFTLLGTGTFLFIKSLHRYYLWK